MAVAYANYSSHSSSVFSSPREGYDPRVLRFIDQNASRARMSLFPEFDFVLDFTIL